MAKTPFKCEVLTPEGEVFNDEVTMVSTKTAVGSIGILAHHQPLLAMLDPAELRLYKGEGGEAVTFVQGEGYLQVQPDSTVLVLVDEVFERDQLNVSEIQEQLERARKEFESAEDGSGEQFEAKRNIRRYEAFLKVAEGTGGGRD
jgi:F-type H+-transporting ATPase subunit epsilon